MNIIDYEKIYDEQIKDLLVELQEYLVEIDDWNTQIMHKNYREEYFEMDMKKVQEHEGKIYLAEENEKIKGLILGVVSEKDEIDRLTNDCAKTGTILELIISKECRWTGIGKELLNKMEQYFKSIGCQRVTIEVFGPNVSAYDFYCKNGYINRASFVSKQLNQNKNTITISKVEQNKEQYMSLLLEADPEKEVVNKYIQKGEMYVLSDGEKVCAEVLVTKVDEDTCELKNIATISEARGKGYAKLLINHIYSEYKHKYKRMIVGTTENMIPFYVLNGFTKYYKTVKNFFIDNYAEDVYDGDLHCIDMYYYAKEF